MRVLLVATWPTHYQPIVPLAWALSAHGHETRAVIPPAHAESVTRSGQIAIPVGSSDVDIPELFKRDVLPLIAAAGDAGTATGNGAATALRVRRTEAAIGIYVSVAQAMAHDTVDFARQWRPDLVVYEPTAFVGPLVAKLLGVPAVRHLWGPDGTSSGPGGGGRLENPALNELAGEFGLSDFDTRGDVIIDPCPASLQTAIQGTLLPMRYVPYNGSMPGAQVPRRDPGKPRVCVSWGISTVALAGAEAFLVPQVVEALSELPVEVVVAARSDHHQMFAAQNGQVRVVEMELRSLLPTCDALIHQGGGGTMLTAVASGVPQLVIPQLPDQRFSARRLEMTGAGRVVPADEFDAKIVRDEVRALLADAELNAAVARLHAENSARPSPTQVVPELERIARK